ncbi:hypothetical protein KI387_037139, partial [Taxus chinensis]
VFQNLKEKDSSTSLAMEPQVDPKKPGVPISYPLKTLEELQNRSYFESFHFPFNKCSVPLPPSRAFKPLENRPRMLVCHDMKGGYVDDKWIQGDSNSDAYAIWHWHLIDIFVYFSHNLVTLPPPCWTNTAHRHGVQVLGTFITEWEEGQTTCKTLLASKESAQMYADRLTELAVKLGFDGWLLNMEVKLDLEQVTNLKEFVDHLTVSMHHALPGSLVIWKICLNIQLLWRENVNLMYTWALMYLEEAHMVEDSGRADESVGWRTDRTWECSLHSLIPCFVRNTALLRPTRPIGELTECENVPSVPTVPASFDPIDTPPPIGFYGKLGNVRNKRTIPPVLENANLADLVPNSSIFLIFWPSMEIKGVARTDTFVQDIIRARKDVGRQTGTGTAAPGHIMKSQKDRRAINKWRCAEFWRSKNEVAK